MGILTLFLFLYYFHHGLSQEIGYSSLCYTTGPHCLSTPQMIFITCFSIEQYVLDILKLIKIPFVDQPFLGYYLDVNN